MTSAAESDITRLRKISIKILVLFLFSLRSRQNPFFVQMQLHGAIHPLLVDTGADFSIIDAKLVKNIIQIQSTQTRSAFGAPINIKGILKALTIMVFETKITLSPLVCKGLPDYTIFGSDVIREFSILITGFLRKQARTKISPGVFVRAFFGPKTFFYKFGFLSIQKAEKEINICIKWRLGL